MGNMLDVALSGMRAAQLGIETASHNIANVNVEGFSRQRVRLASAPLVFTNGTLLSGGVRGVAVERIHDRYIARQIRLHLGEQGQNQYLSRRLSEVETVFNESTNEGLGRVINEFYSGISQIAANPESSAVRVTTVNSAQLLATQFRNMRSRLASVDSENRSELAYTIADVNDKLDRLATLNVRIQSAVALGANASDLQDERDNILQHISRTLDASVYVSEDEGHASVSINGYSILLGSNVSHLAVNSAGVYVEGTTSQLDITSGSVGAMLQLRDEILPGHLADLNALASAFITEFNAIHSAHIGLDGSTGLALFTGTDAADIAVNQDILANPSKFAASLTGEPGDAKGAIAMLDLRSRAVLGTASMEEHYASIVGGVGAQVKAATDHESAIGAIITQLTNRRDSSDAVSLDEEMANLIQFQQAYNAAARVVTIVDEMIQTVLALGR